MGRRGIKRYGKASPCNSCDDSVANSPVAAVPVSSSISNDPFASGMSYALRVGPKCDHQAGDSIRMTHHRTTGRALHLRSSLASAGINLSSCRLGMTKRRIMDGQREFCFGEEAQELFYCRPNHQRSENSDSDNAHLPESGFQVRNAPAWYV